MKSSTRALIVLAVFVAAAIGLLGWSVLRTQAEKAEVEGKIIKELSAEDVKTILESQYGQQPGALQQLAGSVEARQNLLDKQFKPLLALASEARKTGVADSAEVKNQLELAELELLGVAYDEKQQPDMTDPRAGAQPFSYIKTEEVEAFYKEAGAEKKFEELVKTLEESNPAKTKIPEAQLKQIKEQYAKLVIAANRAKADKMDADPKTRLLIGFQQARTLAQAYGQSHEKELEVKDEEVKAYIKDHPEYDGSSKKAKAEEVLKRAKAGEDFAALANEFSEDPGNRDQASGAPKGGLYEDIEKGMFQPSFENAALALEPGNIADGLVETPFGYHIIKLEGKGASKAKDAKDAAGKETYNVRHVLIGTTFQDPKNPMARPVPFEQAAKQAAQQAKVQEFIKGIEARNPINLPKAEDIKLDAPAMPENPMMPGMPPGAALPPGMDEQHGPDDGHNHGGSPAPKGKPAEKPKNN